MFVPKWTEEEFFIRKMIMDWLKLDHDNRVKNQVKLIETSRVKNLQALI